MLNHMSGTVGVLHGAAPRSMVTVGDTTRATTPTQFYGRALHDEALRHVYPQLFTWEFARDQLATYASLAEQFTASEWEARLLERPLPLDLRRTFFRALAEFAQAQETLADFFCSTSSGPAAVRQRMLRILETIAQESSHKAQLIGRALDSETEEYEAAIYEELFSSRRSTLDQLYETLEYEYARADELEVVWKSLYAQILELCDQAERTQAIGGPVKEAFISLLQSVDLARVPCTFPMSF